LKNLKNFNYQFQNKKRKKKQKAVEFTFNLPESTVQTLPTSPKEENIVPVVLPTYVDPRSQEYTEMMMKFRQVSSLEKEDELKEFFVIILGCLRQDSNPTDLDEQRRLIHTENGCDRLFEMLDRRLFPKSIIKSFLLIKRKLVTQEYNDAEKNYFDLTIGTTNWPTSKTDIDDLENDEKREVLQSVKRLMTFWKNRMAPKFYTLEQVEELQQRGQWQQTGKYMF